MEVISKVFPNLVDNHKRLLSGLLDELVNIIIIKFRVHKNILNAQLIQNNYQDYKGLVFLLLPYINADATGRQKIRSLNDLYVLKNKFTNIQYNRVKRDNQEITFNEEYLRNNFELLKDTINQIANKLYVNWIDIRPYTRVKITEATNVGIIMDTQNVINNRTLVDDEMAPGFSVGDIYNTLSNDLYNNIKDIKWTIFDVRVGEKLVPFIVVVDDILGLGDSLNGKDYKVTSNWSNLIRVVSRGAGIGNYNSEAVEKVLRTLLWFFDKKSQHINDPEFKDSGYVRLNTQLDPDDNEDDEDDEARTISRDQVIRTANSLNYEYMYDFLTDQLTAFKRSYYGKLLLNYENGLYTIKKDEERKFVSDLQYKNLYNFAKSLVHNFKLRTTEKAIWVKQYPHSWKMLNYNDRKTVLERLNWDRSKNNVTEWFNIEKYIRTYFRVSGSNATEKNNKIFVNIMNNLAFIVYDVLVTKGALSQFVPERRLTDNNVVPEDIVRRKDYMRTNLREIVMKDTKYGEAYYYLTGQRYIDLKINNDNYIDYVWKNDAAGWVSFYAMNWVSQISFFHHYLNNRVMFVTGGTGVGKSTQMPKLLLYATKTLDYKYAGKCICTQPRKAPTQLNAQTISREMGVPITLDETDTDNYFVQYKHEESAHVKETRSDLMLRIVTDGTLLQELINNPLLKNKNQIHNTYDVVIVDESHEHNYNMDLILTLMKYTAYYNNNVKLVLISATMEEDEPIYRRYYREINDNRMYPLDRSLEQKKLDRINVDRRMHISAPDATTRFKITDIYTPDKDPEELVAEIVRKSISGDVLLFKPGEKEIREAVEKLNSGSMLPSDTIALPFFSKLPDEKRELIENIDKSGNKDKLVLAKSESFVDFDPSSSPNQVPKGTYKRVVIVATNIAEASITISSLKYVVDTGIQRGTEYNHQIGSSIFVDTPISETSRVQRRGRVGRVSSGTVYYTYKEGTMAANRTAYKIAISDISDNLFDMLQDSPNEKVLLPENISNLDYATAKNDRMLLQYFDRQTFISYYGNPAHYDYANDKPPHPHYETGYSKESLDDRYGTFYIIHPEELCFKRDLVGKIVKLDSEISTCNIQLLSDGSIVSPKMQSFWNTLLDRALIEYVGEDKVAKTEYGKNIMKLKQELELRSQEEMNSVVAYIYGRKYGVGDDILKLVSLFKVISSVGGLVTAKRLDLRSYYKERVGDACALIKILDSIHSTFVGYRQDSIRTLNILREQKSLFDQKRYGDMIDKKLVKRFKKIKVIDDKKLMELAPFVQRYEINNNLAKRSKELEKWSVANKLDFNVVTKYISEYYNFSSNLSDKFDWFDKNIKVNNTYPDRCKNIVASLLAGYRYNVAKRIGVTDIYMLVNYPDPRYTYLIKQKWGAKYGEMAYDTTLQDLGDYILFIKNDTLGLGLIQNITPELIRSVYNAGKFKQDIYSGSHSKKMIEYLISLFDTEHDNRFRRADIANQYSSSVNKIRMDLGGEGRYVQSGGGSINFNVSSPLIDYIAAPNGALTA
jgi:hypothetical protein